MNRLSLRWNKASVLARRVILLVIILLSSARFLHSEFKYCLPMRDNSVFRVLRYHVFDVGRFPLSDGDYAYQSKSLPSEHLTLELYVRNGSESQRTQLTSFRSHVAISVEDESGRLVCKADGNLSESNGVAVHKWVLATSGSDAYYWNSDCRDIAIQRHKTYNIAVHVSETEKQRPSRELTLAFASDAVLP
jgi:hypothetical protein